MTGIIAGAATMLGIIVSTLVLYEYITLDRIHISQGQKDLEKVQEATQVYFDKSGNGVMKSIDSSYTPIVENVVEKQIVENQIVEGVIKNQTVEKETFTPVEHNVFRYASFVTPVSPINSVNFTPVAKTTKTICGCGNPNCTCGTDCKCTPDNNCSRYLSVPTPAPIRKSSAINYNQNRFNNQRMFMTNGCSGINRGLIKYNCQPGCCR